MTYILSASILQRAKNQNVIYIKTWTQYRFRVCNEALILDSITANQVVLSEYIGDIKIRFRFSALFLDGRTNRHLENRPKCKTLRECLEICMKKWRTS
jgi:hypothetical protein